MNILNIKIYIFIYLKKIDILQENKSQSSEQILCQILGWYRKKWTFKYDFVEAVPNVSTRWYTGTLDFHLLFECSDL